MNVMAEFESIMEGMERSQREKKTDVVKTLSKGYVLVDTCYTIDHGYETMVFKCDSKGEALERIGGQPDDTPDQIIVSTDNNTYGAIGILGKLDYLKKRFGKFYVLPSSVHEVIVVPDNGMIDRNSLTRMVKEVNATTVADDEILGSKAYAFI